MPASRPVPRPELPLPACLHADFNLDFYLEVQNLRHLVRRMGDSPFTKKYRCACCRGACGVQAPTTTSLPCQAAEWLLPQLSHGVRAACRKQQPC